MSSLALGVTMGRIVGSWKKKPWLLSPHLPNLYNLGFFRLQVIRTVANEYRTALLKLNEDHLQVSSVVW